MGLTGPVIIDLSFDNLAQRSKLEIPVTFSPGLPQAHSLPSEYGCRCRENLDAVGGSRLRRYSTS